MSRKKYNNMSFTYEPKFKDPATNIDDHEHRWLVPAVKDQKSKANNLVIVTCSPGYNGIYSGPAGISGRLVKWQNKKLDIYYVPLEECDKVCSLEEVLEHKDEVSKYLIKNIKKQQQAGINGEVNYHPYVYKSVPDWCLPGVKLKNQPEVEKEEQKIVEVKPTIEEKPKATIEVYKIQLW